MTCYNENYNFNKIFEYDNSVMLNRDLVQTNPIQFASAVILKYAN